MWGLRFFPFPQIKICLSMPVTYLIWDALHSSPHLAAAHADSTPLHTSMTLTPPEEDDREEKRMHRNLIEFIFLNYYYYLVVSFTCYLHRSFLRWSHFLLRSVSDCLHCVLFSNTLFVFWNWKRIFKRYIYIKMKNVRILTQTRLLN